MTPKKTLTAGFVLRAIVADDEWYYVTRKNTMTGYLGEARIYITREAADYDRVQLDIKDEFGREAKLSTARLALHMASARHDGC